MTNLNFDATTVETTTEEETKTYSPLDAGEYEVMMIDSIVKDNKAGTGKYLSVTLDVIQDKGKGRRIFDMFNFEHQNPKAQEIGKRKLADLCKVLNKEKVGDSSEMHNKPMLAVIDIEKNEQFGDRNRVKFYKKSTETVKSDAVTAFDDDCFDAVPF